MLLRLALILVACALIACEPRQPMNRSTAVGLAESHQRQLGVDWGAPLDVTPPDTADIRGRRWWQVRYQPGDDGHERIILIDHETGWARLPPPSWQVLRGLESPRPELPPDALRPGADVLIVSEAGGRGDDALEREVRRLNGLAAETGLAPLFSLRRGRDGSQIVYGWQGEGGMRRDDAVRDWLRLRTPYRDPYWIELTR